LSVSMSLRSSELQYRYLFSRLRRLHGTNIPIRMRSASNPGGEGHEWVKQRFITSDRKDRIFIPARLADNPYLDQHEYRESLNELDPVTRKQLLNGDWTARHAGSWFRREYFDERILDAHDLPAGRASVRYWDLAATEKKPGTDPDYTVGTLMSVDPYGRYYIEDVVRLRGTPASVEYRIKETAGIDGVDVEVWMEEEPGASGKHVIDHYRRQVLPGYAFRGDRVTGPKDVRARPLATQCEGRNVWLVRGPWIGDWIDEAEAWPHGAHKDQVDSASGALSKLVFADEEPTVGPQIYV